MRYMGGKSRISKPIAENINDFSVGRTFASLFCGACSVESKVKGYEHIILNDKQEYLIALLKAVQQGYIPPEEMTVDEYKYNSTAFWQYMRELSEQTAPDDFTCIWEKPLCRTLDVNKANNFIVTEKLFIYEQKRN